MLHSGGFRGAHKIFPKNMFMKLSIKQEILDILTVTEIFLKYNDLKKKNKKKTALAVLVILFNS